ncbi:two-component system, sensor histidine kinase YesM [Cohnella sp. OV330]|uniref:sensor histidine kinase n=1 Tax=Cohnella sp. OV330 TaxID=1855288 RepID=UPI0008E96227|nr:histidine kinase [Cohnella sp. OV330]SFB62406.1 two-component system, sensor histidine kinase YesM [Cohnella sp. OV330]
MRRLLEKWIIGATRKLNLRSKILVLYGLILLLPTLALGIGAIYLVIHSFTQSYMSAADEAVSQSAKMAEFSKRSYDLLAVRTATDGELIARLGREYTDMPEIVDTVNYVDRTFLITSKYLPGIADFRIYHTNETLVQDGQLLWRPEDRMLSGMDERTWYREGVESDAPLVWSNATNNPKMNVITRKIIGPSGDVLGLVYILLNYDAVFGELLDHPFKGSGSLYIVDAANRILATSDEAHIGNRIKLRSDASAGDSSAESGGSARVLDLSRNRELQIVKPLESGWKVVALIHMKYMDRQNLTILLLIVGITALFLLLSVSLMMTIVKNIVWRIRKLGARMSDVAQGEFEVTVRSQGRDELGDLENVFNSMSVRLGRLVEDITRAGLMEKEQAFRSLQAQINPHFIYNSLGLLRWRAIYAKDDEQIRIIDALTTFYRLTLNNQISVIRVREELEHVKAYLDICQFRYPGRVRIEWEVEEAALDCYTIKTVLQPIVENCYQHGAIARRPDARIVIAAAAEDGRLRMTVYDNGLGMAETTMRELEAGAYASSSSKAKNGANGFGIANIRKRLALYFGGDASLTFRGEQCVWTQVELNMPSLASPPSIRREMSND